MSYFNDVYRKRVETLGANPQEQYTSISKRYFADYLVNSPAAVSLLLNDIPTVAAVHSNREDESKISKYFLFDIDRIVNVGNLIVWDNEHWLIIQKEKRTIEAYSKVLAVRCNYELKWIDNYGKLQSQYCYLFGSLDSTIQNSFRISNGIVFPKENRNLEIIMPFTTIPKKQRFIINEEAWRTVDRDLTSVNGILYMTLIEDLIAIPNDSLPNQVADYDKLNSGTIDLGLTSLSLNVGQSFTFAPSLMLNDQLASGYTFSLATNNKLVTISGLEVTAVTAGTSTITCSLVEQPEVTTTCSVTIVSSGATISTLQILGDNNIKWGRTRTYTVFYYGTGSPVEIDSTFEIIGSSTLCTITDTTHATCSIKANSTGITGDIVLRATTLQGVVNKTISIASLW
jgi:hypothetical protein